MKVKRVDSSDQNVSKYVYDFGNAVAESVLYKYPTYEDRTVICCSTQSGCPIGCRFCGAGDNFVRNLTADEIVEQVQYLFVDRNIDSTKVQKGQIMFMSMGEPLLNKNGLTGAIRKLNKLYPNFALLISTSAPKVDYGWVRNLSVEVPSVGLQFSVHEAFDKDRNKLIPFKKKLKLREIAEQGELWFNTTGRQPFFNYCAHENNTSQKHVDELVSLFDPRIWQSTVSVICEREESVAAANSRQRNLATDFMEKLLTVGYSTRTFDPAGQDDVGGGCGQLWYVQDWMKNNPKYAKPSIGRELPSVHTPVDYATIPILTI